jgi:hypothetical protein
VGPLFFFARFFSAFIRVIRGDSKQITRMNADWLQRLTAADSAAKPLSMLIGYVSDENYVALADVALEFTDGQGGSWETRSRARATT